MLYVVCFVCPIAECIGVTMSHLKHVILSTDNEQVKLAINRLCELLSPAEPGVFLPVLAFLYENTSTLWAIKVCNFICKYNSCMSWRVMFFGWEGDLAESNGSLPLGDDLKVTCWLPIHRDQLRAQRSITCMGKLYLFSVHGFTNSFNNDIIFEQCTNQKTELTRLCRRN